MSQLTNYRREVALTGLWHDYANLFPMLDAAAQDALRADIQAHGVREPVILFGGRILDGRNRYMAARDLGMDFPVVDFSGTDADALAYVLSTNLHRRHLTESQRAAVAAKLANIGHGGAERFSQDANLHLGEAAPVSLGQAAEMLAVSRRSVATAKTVLDHGAPELMAAVDRGEIAVSAAAAVSELPMEEQVSVVAEGPKAIKAKAKQIREAKQSTPDEAPDESPEATKLRRGLNGLTRDALLDDLIAEKLARREDKAKIAAQKAEIEDLKSRLAEATQGDLGRALGNAQRRADQFKGRLDEVMQSAKRMERRMKIVEGERDAARRELENVMIPLN